MAWPKRMRDDELSQVAMYGWQDRGAGQDGPVHVIGQDFRPECGQAGSLGAVWTVLRGTGNCAIVRLADGRRIAQRGMGGAWELVKPLAGMTIPGAAQGAGGVDTDNGRVTA